MLRFRIGRIPVSVGGSFVLISLLLSLQRRDPALMIEWLLVVFVSVLAHELGHAGAARAFGLEPQVALHAMGGTTSFRPPPKFPPWKRIAITLAGPFAGFALGGAVLLWARLAPAPPGSMPAIVQADLIWVNLGWGLLNLLPIAPLDGGQVMVELFGAAFGRRGAQVGRAISIGFAAALAALAFVYGWTLAAFLCVWLLVVAVRGFVAHAAFERDRPLEPLVEEGKRALEADDGVRAIAIGREGLSRARTPGFRRAFAMILTQGALIADDAATAVEGLGLFPPEAPPDAGFRGSVMLQAGRVEEAIDLLRDAMRDAEARGGGVEERHLLDEALFGTGRFSEAAAIAERGFELHQDPRFAYNAACSHAKLGAPERALTWLTRAVDAGWTDVELLMTDPDLRPLRDLPGWPALMARAHERAMA